MASRSRNPRCHSDLAPSLVIFRLQRLEEELKPVRLFCWLQSKPALLGDRTLNLFTIQFPCSRCELEKVSAQFKQKVSEEEKTRLLLGEVCEQRRNTEFVFNGILSKKIVQINQSSLTHRSNMPDFFHQGRWIFPLRNLWEFKKKIKMSLCKRRRKKWLNPDLRQNKTQTNHLRYNRHTWLTPGNDGMKALKVQCVESPDVK